MKRDWALIREILLAIEHRKAALKSDLLVIDGYSKPEIAEHVLLMHEIRLVRSRRETPDSAEYLITGLTEEGQRTLRSIGDKQNWAAIQSIAQRFDVPLTADTILLISYYLASQSRHA